MLRKVGGKELKIYLDGFNFCLLEKKSLNRYCNI